MLAWLTEHIDDVMAIIGTAYALALLVVKLTPTPRDDRAVDQVYGWVKGICAIFGLTPYQGVVKPEKTTGYRPKA